MRLAHWEAHDRDDYLGNLVYQRENLEWRQVPGEEYYYVSNYGDVIRLAHDITCSERKGVRRLDQLIIWSEDQKTFGGNDNKTYRCVKIGNHTEFTHRVVGKAFIPNPDNKPQINHKDGNPKNNYAGCAQNGYKDSNLEWVTCKENMVHASQTGLLNTESELRKEALKQNRTQIDYDMMKKPIVQLDKEGHYIARYESGMEASRQTSIDVGDINDCCRHIKYRKSAGGYQWLFEEEYDPNQSYIYHNYGSNSNARNVEQYDMEGNFIAEYASILEACRVTGWSGNSYISEVCNGKRKHYKNCIWKYKNPA